MQVMRKHPEPAIHLLMILRLLLLQSHTQEDGVTVNSLPSLSGTANDPTPGSGISLTKVSIKIITTLLTGMEAHGYK